MTIGQARIQSINLGGAAVPKEEKSPPPLIYSFVYGKCFNKTIQARLATADFKKEFKSRPKKSVIQKICTRVATGVRTTPFTLSATLALLTNNYQLSYDE